VSWVSSALISSSPSSASFSEKGCKYDKLGSVCLLMPAPAFYGLMSALFIHVLQAFLYVIVAKKRYAFSICNAGVVFLVPIFGLFAWYQLLSRKSSPKETLLSNFRGEAYLHKP
jgi:nicotinamide riboside transporter PnuC